MAQQNGKFLIDDSVSEEVRNKIKDKALQVLEKMKNEVSDREPIIKKRQDFFEGRHHKWTNVVGQVVKQQEGHILAVFNYISRFCYKLIQTLTNRPPKIKIKPRDEANEIETSRAERVEETVLEILNDKKNKFFDVTFVKCGVNQVRDGDFTFECKVMDENGKKRVQISPNEDLLKIMIGWDDAAGSSFSFAAFKDLWSTDKILREYGYEAEPIADSTIQSSSSGDHVKDQYGILSSGGGAASTVPTGVAKTPKAEITDYWSYELINNQIKIVNLIFINKDMVQFVVTEYKDIPRFVGHSMVVAGKPWSKSFIDDLIDPQIELNDRSSEEGDLIRIGSHMKFLAVNMSDFDPDSVKPGSGQVIFIEGEGADFRPLAMNISPFPSADYINRVMEHMFTLGLPKIALASGTAPYTGKVGAIQYQPFSDLVEAYRKQWNVVIIDLIRKIQEYLIAYFPETHSFMRESVQDPITGQFSDGEMIVREVELDWDNVLPLSRSDKVVDAANLRDRGAISLHTFLEEAGFRNPDEEIKKLKKESKDAELMVLLAKFNQFAPGAVQAQLKAQVAASQVEESQAETMGTLTEAAKGNGTPSSNPPIMNQSQNERRGVLSSTGTPTGQTATPAGAVAQETQNLNAQNGV